MKNIAIRRFRQIDNNKYIAVYINYNFGYTRNTDMLIHLNKGVESKSTRKKSRMILFHTNENFERKQMSYKYL